MEEVAPMSSTLVAGLDLGSTGIKLLVLDEQAEQVFLDSASTPWTVDADGATVMRSLDLLDVLDQLLRRATDHLAEDAVVSSIAVTGMGESGFLIGADGQALAPAYAWFDRSGQQAVDDLPPQLAAEFAGRTGIPWGVQVSAAKIAHLVSHGIDAAGARWLNLAEFVVHNLGGPAVAERSLIARTGLIDLDTGEPWPALLKHLGVPLRFVPPVVQAGTGLGQADAGAVPGPFAGATLMVAGHDHLVSSLTGEHPSSSRYHVSMGTAEVLLRVLDQPPSFAARQRLASYLINCVPHVLPERWVVVAGVKTGLLMRRALTMLGVHGEPDRQELDRAVLALLPGRTPPGLAVTGARNDDGVLTVTVGTDDISPALLMKALLDHGNAEIARLIEAIDAEMTPATSTLLTGGWTSWTSVRRARAAVLPALEISDRSQDTAYGAALTALAHLDPPAPQPTS